MIQFHYATAPSPYDNEHHIDSDVANPDSLRPLRLGGVAKW
jgi:hypothetical protein